MTSPAPVVKHQSWRTIKCTEQNAPAMQQIVKATPGLLSLVKKLQEQNLFPGLRAMTVTITGTPDIVAKGLDAWPEIFAASQRAEQSNP